MAQLTDQDMMTVKAIAPFEVALIFEAWAKRMEQEYWEQGESPNDPDANVIITGDVCGGLGPPFRLLGEERTPFGRRMAAGIFTLLKEI